MLCILELSLLRPKGLPMQNFPCPALTQPEVIERVRTSSMKRTKVSYKRAEQTTKRAIFTHWRIDELR